MKKFNYKKAIKDIVEERGSIHNKLDLEKGIKIGLNSAIQIINNNIEECDLGDDGNIYLRPKKDKKIKKWREKVIEKKNDISKKLKKYE